MEADWRSQLGVVHLAETSCSYVNGADRSFVRYRNRQLACAPHRCAPAAAVGLANGRVATRRGPVFHTVLASSAPLRSGHAGSGGMCPGHDRPSPFLPDPTTAWISLMQSILEPRRGASACAVPGGSTLLSTSRAYATQNRPAPMDVHFPKCLPRRWRLICRLRSIRLIGGACPQFFHNPHHQCLVSRLAHGSHVRAVRRRPS